MRHCVDLRTSRSQAGDGVERRVQLMARAGEEVLFGLAGDPPRDAPPPAPPPADGRGRRSSAAVMVPMPRQRPLSTIATPLEIAGGSKAISSFTPSIEVRPSTAVAARVTSGAIGRRPQASRHSGRETGNRDARAR
jgi:hypothetical protein